MALIKFAALASSSSPFGRGLAHSCILFLGSCAATTSRPALIESGTVVLFQGDSITDAGRNRKTADQANDPSGLGRGYAAMAGAALVADVDGAPPFVFNRGISGHKVFQLSGRWERDSLSLEPDVLSVLIGVNDYWHTKTRDYDGTLETYEADYDALLTRTREELPEVTLVVCEPFVLRCGVIDDSWFPAFDGYRAAAHRIAKKHGALFVPFQSAFNGALTEHPPEYWAKDGVHPTEAGAALMAETWISVVRGRRAAGSI